MHVHLREEHVQGCGQEGNIKRNIFVFATCQASDFLLQAVWKRALDMA